VSRRQCTVKCLSDGSAILEAKGVSPTMWRPQGGQWFALNCGQSCPLSDGDQISVDARNPDGVYFQIGQEMGGYQDTSQQQGYQQQDYQQQGYPQQLPPGWEMFQDQQTGAYYYYNQQTGASQWDPPAY
jgi:hypothetical protein